MEPLFPFNVLEKSRFKTNIFVKVRWSVVLLEQETRGNMWNSKVCQHIKINLSHNCVIHDFHYITNFLTIVRVSIPAELSIPKNSSRGFHNEEFSNYTQFLLDIFNPDTLSEK
ncbi:hypothetical protein AVEN_106919-1 [Araneus ventricosus]|uniref:Uncharacterized protein n=1 Tax=Araneus ventricosus TaxID=182803 RepID=A0A4Y2NPU6_ARAVE|nr:hypothetical protein AVEN_106919-1 [Araneus ventricosus]